MATRLGILTMDDLPDHARPILGDYPDLYAHLLRDEPVELVTFAGHRGELPTTPDACDGWLIGGSRHSVYDELDWIRAGEGFVRAAVTAERPIVGICFGHQLVASALGGTVQAAPGGWGLGAREYRVERTSPWFAGDRVTLVASHRDQVTAMPPGASRWASADYCPIAGMTIGDHVWTIQGHPEFTAPVASALYAGRVATVGEAAVERARATLSRPLSNRAIAEAIVRFVNRRRGSG